MKPSRRVLKIAAVVSSVTLMGLYVYDRAGGNLIQKIYPGVAAEDERPMMSSSKVKLMLPAAGQKESTSPQLLPGSKSALVVPETSWESKPVAPNAPSSESAAGLPNYPVGDSDDPFSPRGAVPPPNTPATPPGTQPRSGQSTPAEAAPPKVLLHGSKSAAPLIPVPPPQAANPKVFPNGPAQKIPFQQRQQSVGKPGNNSAGR